VTAEEFLFIGQGLSADEFTEYVRGYRFGRIPPDFVVLHHTAIPSLSSARFSSGDVWDAGEDGLSEGQVHDKRLKSLTRLREFYRTSLGWDRGPHLFVDDRYIWLFTPMYDEGIHAKWGNAFRDGQGKLHYSVGIEVIGYYGQERWPEPVARLVGHAVATLSKQLGSFELRYLYPNGSPGRIGEGKNVRCAHPERLAFGGISSHRDYNKPQCPGAAITESYYMEVIKAAAERLQQAPVQPTITTTTTTVAPTEITAGSPLLGPPSGNLEQVVGYVRGQLPDDSEYKNDLELIFGYYWSYGPPAGVDPFLAAVQCVYETDALRSFWAGRPRRNPANLGVRREAIGFAFATWEEGVQAQLGQLLALALADNVATETQRQLMRRNPGHSLILANARGAATTLQGLSGRWSSDPSYAEQIVALATKIRAG
jgi:hypothetical protein